jgi:hypothetical protein
MLLKIQKPERIRASNMGRRDMPHTPNWPIKPEPPYFPDSLDSLLLSTFDDMSKLVDLHRTFPDAFDGEFVDYVEHVHWQRQQEELRRKSEAVVETTPLASRESLAKLTGLVESIQSKDAIVDELFLDLVEPAFGTVWTTRVDKSMAGKNWGVTELPPNVVILASAGSKNRRPVFSVMLASSWAEFATDCDMILPERAEHSEMMLEIWNEHLMKSDQLHKCIGFLTKEEEHWLTMMRKLVKAKTPTDAVPARFRGSAITPEGDEREIYRWFEQARAILLWAPMK